MRTPSVILLAVTLAACSGVPGSFDKSNLKPSLFPDYTDVTAPSNIAPLNFIIQEEGERFVTVLESGSKSITVTGKQVRIKKRQWNSLKKDGKIDVTVYKKTSGQWTAMQPFGITLEDEIDPFISYRQIMPSVDSYQDLSIRQRNLESFSSKVVYSNSMVQDLGKGQCINCHHYRNYGTDNMQFHVRQYLGGTVMVIDGNLRKVNLKTDSTISAGVYPAWHPTHDYIAYSTNMTYQSVHTVDLNRIEVVDLESDLIMYDIKGNAVSVIENDPDQFECFPAWSPDGRMLYYVSAHYETPFDDDRMDRIFADSRNIKYNLYCKPFDPDTRTWGKSVLLFDAAAVGKSVTLPRVSPDGRRLIFALGEYGVFHIWHRDSDLWMMDLANGSMRPLDEINSPEVESYHSWSSNGKWIIFSTRREDGAYTRLYLSHLEADGHFSKPFALPQKKPGFNRRYMYSFNIPEFMKEPVKVSPRKFASFIEAAPASTVKYEPKLGE